MTGSGSMPAGRGPVTGEEGGSMRLGSISLWGADVDAFRRQIRDAEGRGHEILGVGDTPSAWQDMVVTLTIAALASERATLATTVTTPFLRHPLVLARAMSSLADLTGGRVVLGIGGGGSAVASVGRPPASVEHLRRYVLALQSLFDGETVEWEGARTAPLVGAHRVPVYLAADGPAMLRLAGEIADGVILTGCSTLDFLDRRLEILRAAAADAGRDPGAVDVWAMSYVSIRDTRDQAVEDIAAYLAVMGGLWLRKPYARALVPPELEEAARTMIDRYRPSEHVVVGSPQARLVQELGLTGFLAGLTAVAGTPDEVGATLRAFEQRGVGSVVASLAGVADPAGTLQRLEALMRT